MLSKNDICKTFGDPSHKLRVSTANYKAIFPDVFEKGKGQLQK